MAGMFFSGIALVLQKSAAVRRDTYEKRISNPVRRSPMTFDQVAAKGEHTFSCRVNCASFFRAKILVSLRTWDFCGGLDGGENSVLGVEPVRSLPTGDMLDSSSWSSARLSGDPMLEEWRRRREGNVLLNVGESRIRGLSWEVASRCWVCSVV